MSTKDKLGRSVSVGDRVVVALRGRGNAEDPILEVVEVQAISSEGMIVTEHPLWHEELWIDADRTIRVSSNANPPVNVALATIMLEEDMNYG